VVRAITLRAKYTHGIACFGARLERFRMAPAIHVVERRSTGGAEIQGSVSAARDRDFRRVATGRMSESCGAGSIVLTFPASLPLGPKSANSFTVDIPKQLTMYTRRRKRTRRPLEWPSLQQSSASNISGPYGLVKMVLDVGPTSSKEVACFQLPLPDLGGKLPTPSRSCAAPPG
jgi:hypothetical protein